MSESLLPIHFNGLRSYLCLVCGEKDADKHMLSQQADGHYYSGLSFHNSCFNLEIALRAERQAREADAQST